MEAGPRGGAAPGDAAWQTAHASRLVERAGAAGDLALLSQAVTEFEQVLAAVSPADANYAAAAVNLASALITQFEWTGETEALANALTLLQDTVARPFSSREREAIIRGALGWALLRDAERSGHAATIKRAVAERRRALRLSGKLNPLYAERLSDFGAALAQQFSMTGDVRAISEAIAVHEAAVSATSPDDAQLANRLGNLASALNRRAMRTGNADDLQEGVNAHRLAVAAARPGDPGIPMHLSNLGIALMYLYEQTGSRPALDEAITRQREALEATPDNHVEREPRRTNLAAALLSLYERTAQLAMLGEVVELYRAAVDKSPAGHGNRTRHLYGLGSALARRAEHTGDLASLDEAISSLTDVVELTPDSHPNKANRLSALAAAKYLLFQELPGKIDQLDSAISLTREALDLTPVGDVQRPRLLSNLGGMLDSRFEQTHEVQALQEALRYQRDAVAAVPNDHSERAKYLSNLGIALIHQARIADDNSVLDEAIGVCGQALDSLPAGDAGRAQTLLALGSAYQLRFERTKNAQALADGIAAFREAAEDGTAPVPIRVRAGRDGGRLAASADAVDDALKAFANAVQLMDQAAWIGLGREDQERLLSQVAGLPMDAAAMAIESGLAERAVELLEQGRGVLLSREMEAPSQRAALRERAPELAYDLAEVQQALNVSEPAMQLGEKQLPHRAPPLRTAADLRNEFARRRDGLLEQIRSRPDLQDLVAPPQFSRLRSAAAEGPVVILNVSTYRCDALVVANDNVRVIRLPDLSVESVTKYTTALLEAADSAAAREVSAVLQWLWDSIVEPIFGELGLTSGPASGEPFQRLWWCSTGASAFLPLHAAGHYGDGGVGSDSIDSALDLVVSSYTPTLRALIQLRERIPEHTAIDEGPLIVAMPETPGALPLAGAEREADDLKSRFVTFTLLSGPGATLTAVTDAMRNHQWVHFSCHGVQNPITPSRARLVLHDGSLTIQKIASMNLSNPSLAYLSACDTYRGGSDIPDEGITLAAALQLAGYQHVIATLWQIGVTTSDVARHFYNQLVKTDNGIARIDVNDIAPALRAAIAKLREESPGIPPMYWAAYIHTGP